MSPTIRLVVEKSATDTSPRVSYTQPRKLSQPVSHRQQLRAMASEKVIQEQRPAPNPTRMAQIATFWNWPCVVGGSDTNGCESAADGGCVSHILRMTLARGLLKVSAGFEAGSGLQNLVASEDWDRSHVHDGFLNAAKIRKLSNARRTKTSPPRNQKTIQAP